MADDEKGNSRRDLLRTLSGARFFSSVAETITTSGKRPDVNPPSERPVIPAGREQEILQLLGGAQVGEVWPGYQLEKALVSAERIDYVFRGPETRAVVVSLVSLANVSAGIVHAYSRSFRILVSGDAPEEVRFHLGDRVAEQIQQHDDGQLWVTASTSG
jgi:hypothetical protein